jgi:putative ABC transport system permease protein
LTVTARYRNTALVKDLVVSPATFGPHDPQAVDKEILVAVRPGASIPAVQAELTRVVAPYGAPPVQTLGQYQSTASRGINTVLGLVYVLLALSVLIALLGIANTLALSIFERTRELGLLRAVGQSRAQTRSMVRWEAVVVSVFGAVGGVAVGVLLGWAVVRTASSSTLSAFALPVVPLLVVLVVGALAGVLAALRPSRRAARLDPLRALVVT